MSSVLENPATADVESHWLDVLGFKVDVGSRLKMTEEEFGEFCSRNRDLRIERTKEGDIIIMPPTHSKTGVYNFNLVGEFSFWCKTDGSGIGFDSSAGFTLPDGAIRAPDLSWVFKERWDGLSSQAQRSFAHICPDFVVEVRSDTDSLSVVVAKMVEYLENGAQLGWLLDPIDRRVYVYRPGQEVEIHDDPQTISGEPLLKGFVLKLAAVWDLPD